jgi:hypothetical protein
METMERYRRGDCSIRQVARNFDLTETVLPAQVAAAPNHHPQSSTSGDRGLSFMTHEHLPVPCNG